MAAQDLIISRRGPAAPASYLDPDASGNDGPDGASILFGVLRKRWLLLLFIALASGGLAGLGSYQLGRSTAYIDTSLIYTGLPDSSRISQHDSLAPATGAEMITSPRVLDQLCKRRGLGITPVQMAEYIQTDIGRSSSLLNLTLTWDNETDGILLLNELAKIFIEEMAALRQGIQREHLQHLEMTLLQATGRVDEARRQLEALRKQQQQQLDKGGLTTEKYRSALNTISSTDLAIDATKRDQAGLQQQIDAVSQLIAATATRQEDLEKELKTELLHEASAVFEAARKRHAPTSNKSRQLEQTIAYIAQFAKAADAPKEFDRWEKRLMEFIEADANGLVADDRTQLQEAFEKVGTAATKTFQDITQEQRKLNDQRAQMQLQLIKAKSQIAMLEQDRATYQKQAETLSEQITGISTMQLDELEHSLEEAEKLENGLAVQRDSLRQLAESRLREWSVSVPASQETTRLASSRPKLFVVIFALCGLVLSAPLMVAEWRYQAGTPQVRFARALRVPVLAERILSDFSPQQRKHNAQARLTAEQLEALRMLTLRIQQSCHRPGSVILFSSLDARYSAAPLMATVAECLADREERVLLVDAVSPDRALSPVVNVLPADGDAAAPAQGSRAALALATHDKERSGSPGLSEYLSEECEDVHELIRPTGCPGVDLIASGRAGFSREAMASSCLTELLNTCRKNYTMVLVHGPAADCAADLQMLSARADGIVLAATRFVGRDRRARDLVQDLLDLGAPIVGLVA